MFLSDRTFWKKNISGAKKKSIKDSLKKLLSGYSMKPRARRVLLNPKALFAIIHEFAGCTPWRSGDFRTNGCPAQGRSDPPFWSLWLVEWKETTKTLLARRNINYYYFCTYVCYKKTTCYLVVGVNVWTYYLLLRFLRCVLENIRALVIKCSNIRKVGCTNRKRLSLSQVTGGRLKSSLFGPCKEKGLKG